MWIASTVDAENTMTMPMSTSRATATRRPKRGIMMSAGTLPRAPPLLFNSGKPADEPARVARATGYNLAGIAGTKRNELFEYFAAVLERVELVKRRTGRRKHDLIAGLSHGNRRIDASSICSARTCFTPAFTNASKKRSPAAPKHTTALHFASHASTSSSRSVPLSLPPSKKMAV